MEACQRYVNGTINPETGVIWPISIIIDTSETMGEYDIQYVEDAINIFLKRIGQLPDVDNLIEIYIYESHDELEYLAGPGKASNFTISNIRYGGKWCLSDALADVLDVMLGIAHPYDRMCRAYEIPLIIVISDNPVTDDCAEYQAIDEKISEIQSNKQIVPNCCFVSSKARNHFDHHISNIVFWSASNSELMQCMFSIADGIVNHIKLVNGLS